MNEVAPLIRPRKEDASIYVAHKTSVEVFRKELANFFADSDSNIDANDAAGSSRVSADAASTAASAAPIAANSAAVVLAGESCLSCVFLSILVCA